MSRRITLLALTVLLSLGALSASADDLNPPPWRGQPGTTFGIWEFMTPDPNPMPDQGFYPYGPPHTEIYTGFQQEWMQEWEGRLGVWPLSGEIWVTIPNRPVSSPYKDIWIQLTWAQQVPNEHPVISSMGVPATLLNQMPLGGPWFHSTYQIRLIPNPDLETILVTGALNVDELVIDTICIPEPSSLIALAGGMLGMVGFTIRRRR